MKIRKCQIHFFILLFTTCSLLFHPPLDYEANATADWYNDSWEYRKKITTSLDTVISSDLTDFPYLVSFTDSDFTKTTESDGTDIVFTASDGTTELAYEIERFDQSTGEVIAWVKIPTVSASENTDIYIYYKGTATSSSSSVWDSNYKLVYHLNQSSTGTVDEFTDVSDTGNDGTGGGTGAMTQDEDRRPTQVEAKIGYGQSFDGPTQGATSDGTGDYIWSQDVSEWPGNNGSTSDNDTTVEFWAKIDDDHSDEGNMDFFGYHASGNDNEFALFKVASLNLMTKGSLFNSDVDATTSDWTYLMIVYDPGGTSKIYQDGELAEQVDGTSGNKGQRHNGEFVLGGDVDGSGSNLRVNNELQGDLDEFRVSNTIRSADWAAASYCNQNGSNDCQTIGPEEPLTVTITTSNGDCGDTISSDESITFSYTTTFSTSTSDFTIGDITVSGGTVSNFDGSGTTYTFDVVLSSSGTVTVSIAADAATNTAGNGNSVSNTCTLTGDISVVTTSDTSSTSGTCSRHVILGNCGTIAINNDEYQIIDTWTNVPTTEVLVGQPVTVTLSTPDEPSHTKIHFASVHTEVFSIPANFDQTAHIDYSIMSDSYSVTKAKLFQVAVATHRISHDPDVKNLEMFEVVFTMIFAKPMDTSHVVVETKNKHGIPETLYLLDALKVNENLAQALTLEEKSKFSIVDPEPEMNQESPMEPDVKITCGKGTVLKDNLCVPKEWSFLDYFEHLMKLFG